MNSETSFWFSYLLYSISHGWVNYSLIFPCSRPPSFHHNSLPPQLYPCIQVPTVETNKCLIVAREEWPHRSRSLSRFDTEAEEEVAGLKRWLGRKDEVSAMSLKKKKVGKVNALWDGGEGEGDQGVSLETTGAVTTGNLIYLMSSRLHFHPHPRLRRTQNRTLHFPLRVHSRWSLFFFFIFL